MAGGNNASKKNLENKSKKMIIIDKENYVKSWRITVRFYIFINSTGKFVFLVHESPFSKMHAHSSVGHLVILCS